MDAKNKNPRMNANGHEKSGVVFAFPPFYSRLFVFIRGFIHGFLRVDWRSFAVEEVGNRVAG
jgi:hypothetical protein